MYDPLNHPKPLLFFGPIRLVRVYLATRNLTPPWPRLESIRWTVERMWFHYQTIRRSRRIWELEKTEGYHMSYGPVKSESTDTN